MNIKYIFVLFAGLALSAVILGADPEAFSGQSAEQGRSAGHGEIAGSHAEHAEHDGHDEHDEHEAHGDPAIHEKAENDGDHAGHDRDDAHSDDESHADEHAHAVSRDGDGEHEDEVTLTEEQRLSIGIEVEKAGPGSLHTELTLPGETMLNEDGVAHIVPRVSGVALDAYRTSGDKVKKGEVLAVIESAELGEAFSEYMVSRKGYERKLKLYEEKIASQNDYLEALNRFEQVAARLYIKLGKEKFSQAAKMYEGRYAAGAERQGAADTMAFLEKATRYEVVAPISGTIIEKHITRGEKVGEEVNLFTIADLATVWVNLNVPARDIGSVREGMRVEIESREGVKSDGEIVMVSPLVDAETRGATARIILANPQGLWKPGVFVTGRVKTAEKELPLVIAQAAVQNFEGKDIVFLAEEHGFKPVPVTTGRTDHSRVEIVSGLRPGQPVVVKGAFDLKSILATSGMDSHAGHGH